VFRATDLLHGNQLSLVGVSFGNTPGFPFSAPRFPEPGSPVHDLARASEFVATMPLEGYRAAAPAVPAPDPLLGYQAYAAQLVLDLGTMTVPASRTRSVPVPVMSETPSFPVLLARELLLLRIQELARMIAASYPAEPPCLVAVMEGPARLPSLAELPPGRPPCHEIRAASYGEGTTSSGEVVLQGMALDLQDRDIVILEDIRRYRSDDREARRASARQRSALGARLHVAQQARAPRRPARARLGRLRDPDEFVIGFGMDVAGRYREIPHIALYRRELEAV